MKIKHEKVELVLNNIEELIHNVQSMEYQYADSLDQVSPDYRRSAKNLLHYLAMRSVDLSNLQNQLGRWGMSRFARAEGHVLASLLQSRFLLRKMIDLRGESAGKPGLSIKRSQKLLNRNTKALLGYRAKGRRVRIMVTLPKEAADDYRLVEKIVASGMNCARINCAAEGPEVWKRMIENVKKASRKVKRRITIIMDLAGPKIRTGKVIPGPKLIKYSPDRDDGGHVIKPAEILMIGADKTNPGSNALPVSTLWLESLQKGDNVFLRDNRGRYRKLVVKKVKESKPIVNLECSRTVYISTGTALFLNDPEMKTNSVRIGELNPLPGSILLRPDDLMTIHESDETGEPARFDENGQIISQAHVSCTYPPVFKYVKEDDPIYFDDGKIRGKVISTRPGAFDVKISRAKKEGSNLRGDKGINLPKTEIITEGMTLKDRNDLAFVGKYADVVSYSFVNTAKDIDELLHKMAELDIVNKVGIIIKIETRKAFDNLVPILLSAMKAKNIGVMIARGDLAIEAGWDNMGRIQKEILSICSAAHLPVVWATQVLENLTKKGLPSRSEITDAVSALKAECIMLNKGPFIVQSIRFLHKVLSNMEIYQRKQDRMLPSLQPAELINSN